MSIKKARKRAKKFFEYHNLSLPVDVEMLLSQYANVEETYIPLDGDAICINNKQRPHIFIKNNISVFRKRFTYAHELGHLQIPSHTGMISCSTELNEQPNANAYYQMEQEANAFAAELLMPEDWITSLIPQFDNITSLLNKIITEANVSLSAAIYNLIQLLPHDYMFCIYNKIEEYSHIKLGSNSQRPLLLYNESYELDSIWLDINCITQEQLESETINLTVIRFKNILTVDIVKRISKEMQTISKCQTICDKILNTNRISYAHLFNDVIHHLKPGYVIKIKCKASESHKYLFSEGTYTRPHSDLQEIKDSFFSEHCIFHISSQNELIQIDIWHINTEFAMLANPNDSRDSKQILHNIIDNICLEEKERRSLFGRINGIIGNLNGSRTQYTKQQFFDILKQKFLVRTDLTLVTTHADFDQFLYRKIEELYNFK